MDFVPGTKVAWIERLAPGEAFVLAMIKPDAVLAELPAEIDVLVVNDRGKVEEANVQILDDAAGFENALES